VKIPAHLSLRMVVYPSTEEGEDGVFVAHCLDLDVIGCDGTVEGAIAELLQCTEVYLESCEENSISFMHHAPANVWQKYYFAKRAGRKISEELMDRIFRVANRRLGRVRSPIGNRFDEDFLATRGIPEECLVASM